MDKKRLLIVAANGLGRTGVPNVLFQVINALKDFLWIDVVVFNDDDYYYDKIIKCGANIIKVNNKEPKGQFNRFFWRFFFEKRITNKIFTKLFSNKKYDYIHSFKEYDSCYFFKLAAKYGIKERIVHCNNEINKPKNLLSLCIFKKKKKMLYKYTSKLIGVSNDCCIRSYPGLPYMVLFNTYDDNVFNQKLSNLLGDDELVITHVATYSTRKNQLFSVELMDAIHRQYPCSKLNLIGTEVETDYLKQVRNKIKDLGLEDSVCIYDGAKDFFKVFRKTTFLILPSLSEGAPIALVEAQACGITCFSSNLITKDVDCGGIIYCPLDKKYWVNAILKEFNSSKNNRRTYDVSQFSKITFKQRLLNIYKLHIYE